MSDMSLEQYENASIEALQAYEKSQENAEEATKKVEEAIEAWDEAAQEYYFGDMSQEEYEAAQQAYYDALAEEQAAKDAIPVAAAEAQAALDAEAQKREDIRNNRQNNTDYVVHCARIECPYGMRESYLAMDSTHGIFTRNRPQMTVKDLTLDVNIINFGGCFSKENPSVQAAIEQVTNAANTAIENSRDWRDTILDVVKKSWDDNMRVYNYFKNLLGFGGEENKDNEDPRRSECVGECIAKFPANAEWTCGHEKVYVNGEPVLLFRSSLMCQYGGCISVLTSGQPE